MIKKYPSQIIKSKPKKLEEREEKKLKNPSSRTSQVSVPKLKYFSWISSPGMWDFTSGFLSHIGSLGFSQILDSLIMIKPRVSRTWIELHVLVKYMFQIRLSCYYSDYRTNFKTLAMYFFSS